VLFAVPALSLAGLPPSSGFAGKFSLIDAGISAEQWLIVGVALLVSLLTLFSMTKIWAGVFWGEPELGPPLEEGRTNGGPTLMVVATAITVVLSIAYVIFAGPIYELAERAGNDLMNPRVYIDAVLGGEG
jgi:multicomponent Na+:H+ antiporter subunit D